MPSESSAKPFNSLKAAMSCSPRLCEALAGMRRFSTSTGRGLYPSRPIKHDLAPMTVEWTSAGLFGEFFSDEYGVVLFKPGEERLPYLQPCQC